MALAERAPRRAPKGKPKPRIMPPTPARSGHVDFAKQASDVGIELMPWQVTAARYITALGRGDTWLYPEVAVIVARQQGKTTLLLPLIVDRLRRGHKVMHTAQNRELPREVHDLVAQTLVAHYPKELPPKRGVRYGAGQEEIRMVNGGRYRIVAPSRGGARGPSNDLVIVDELREMTDTDFIGAAKPTLTASTHPQMVYLSNAGTEDSVVLNSLRKRAESDPSLAYLEWSAHPDRAADDLAGWVEANPAIGHMPGVLDTLEREYRANLLGGTMAIFETEHLCRWAVTLHPTIVDVETWTRAKREQLGTPRRPVMGIALDSTGTRASGVIAWQLADGSFGLECIVDIKGEPIDLDSAGPAMRQHAAQLGVSQVVFDPYDEHLARHFRRAKPMNGRDYSNACGRFVQALEAGTLHWTGEDKITADLPHATKRTVARDAWMAVKAREEPITALLAAIRAVGAVYRPVSAGAPRIF